MGVSSRSSKGLPILIIFVVSVAISRQFSSLFRYTTNINDAYVTMSLPPGARRWGDTKRSNDDSRDDELDAPPPRPRAINSRDKETDEGPDNDNLRGGSGSKEEDSQKQDTQQQIIQQTSPLRRTPRMIVVDYTRTQTYELKGKDVFHMSRFTPHEYKVKKIDPLDCK